MSTSSVRLSDNISPAHYELRLKPNFSGFTFSGEETIELTLVKSTKEITLHSVRLEIEQADYVRGKSSESGTVVYNEKAETVSFKFLKSLPAGKGKLSIKFKGLLADNLKGFYRSKFEIDGVEKFLATTQFESTDARRAFPCFY